MKKASRIIICVIIIVTSLQDVLPVSVVFAASSGTSYELTINLFNKLLDDENVINSFYTDINNAYPNPNNPKDLVKVAEFGKALTKGTDDNYQKAKIISEWFDKNFTYNNNFYNEKYALHDKYVAQGLTDTEAWVKTNGILDYGPTGDITDRFYDSFVKRTGICLDYARLFWIMAVGAGIPTDRVAGVDHDWNIFWYDTEKRWVLVDSTWHIFDMPIEQFTNYDNSSNHYVLGFTVDENGIYDPPKFYNLSAAFSDTVALYKGEKQGNLPIRSRLTGELKKTLTFVVKTYNDLLKAINIPANDNNRRNIIIQGNITIPKNIDFAKCNVTIDKGYTVTSSGNINLAYNGDWAAVLNVKGTLAITEGITLSVADSGVLNVTGGKVQFEKNAILYWNGRQINGLRNLPVKADKSYYWDGSKFVDKPVVQTYVVKTYNDLLKAIKIPANDNNRRTIIIQGNITIPKNIGTISFAKCNVTIDKGYTVTSLGNISLACNGDWAAVLNVKGTLIISTGTTLDVTESGVLNVVDGKVQFKKNAILYWQGGQINGLPNKPIKTGKYKM